LVDFRCASKICNWRGWGVDPEAVYTLFFILKIYFKNMSLDFKMLIDVSVSDQVSVLEEFDCSFCVRYYGLIRV